MRCRRIWAAVLLAGCTARPAPGSEGSRSGQEQDVSGTSAVQTPELPALDSAQELEDLTPPEGSLNRTVTRELGIPVITVETDRREELDMRVRDQLLVAEYIFMWYNLL